MAEFKAPQSIYYDKIECVPIESQIMPLGTLFGDDSQGTPCCTDDKTDTTSFGWIERTAALGFISSNMMFIIFAFSCMTNDPHGLKANVPLVLTCVLSSAILSALSVVLVRKCARILIYTSAAVTPLALLSGGVFLMNKYWVSGNMHIILPGLVLFALGVYLIGRMSRPTYRSRLETVVGMIMAACDTISDSSEIYIVSGLLSIAFLGYFYLTLQVLRTVRFSLLYTLVSVCMVLWTLGTLESLHHYIMGRLSAAKYFENEVASAVNELRSVVWDMRIFGDICIIGAVRFWWKAAWVFLLAYRYALGIIPSGWTKSLLLSGTGFAGYLESWSCKLSDNALYYIAIHNNTGVLRAANAVVRIFRRNLITCLLTDTSSAFIVYVVTNMSIAIIGCISALWCKDTSTATACLLMSYSTVGFFAGILTSAIDASLVCYAVDLDRNKTHKPQVHQAFSARLTAIRQSNLN